MQSQKRRNWRAGALYVLGMAPAAWYVWRGLDGELGADPIKTLELAAGVWAVRWLLVTLALTPLRELAGVNLARYRRACGLLSFAYACLHLAVYAVLDQALIARAVLQDVATRPFIMLGAGAFALLVPLAATSNQWSMRRLGARWKRLHRLVYLAACMAALHLVLAAKVAGPEQCAYALGLAVLLAYRRLPPHVRRPAALWWPQAAGVPRPPPVNPARTRRP